MSVIFCPHCNFMNADQDAYCADCGKSLTSQPVKLEQTASTNLAPSNIQRNAIVGCCVLSLLLFFFPLLTIHVPIAGEQDVSGYDVFSKLTEFREKLKPPDTTSTSTPYTASPRTPPPELPLSVQFGWLIPLAIIIAFLSAAIALITAFKAFHVSRIMSVIGAACSAAAILHITIM